MKEEPTIRNQKLDYTTKLPIQVWSPLAGRQKDGIWAISGAATINMPVIWTYLGVGNTQLDHVAADIPRASVHVYEDAYVDSIDALTGEHYINNHGYVAKLIAACDSIVHIYGHVSNLVIKDSAQVFLYGYSYVDNAHVEGGLLEADKDAKIHYLTVDEHGRAVINTGALINKLVDKGGIIARSPDMTPFKIKIGIPFNSKSVMADFCQKTTEKYKRDRFIAFNKLILVGIHNCYVSLGVTEDDYCYTVWMSADDYTKMAPYEIALNINNALSSEKAIDIYIDGVKQSTDKDANDERQPD